MVIPPAFLNDLLKALTNVFDAIAKLATEGAEKEFEHWQAKSKIPQAVARVTRLCMVRPLYSPRTDVNLFDCYYPVQVLLPVVVGSMIPTDKRVVPRTVEHLADVPSTGSFIVSGTVGQGKSWFLRQLTVRAALDGILPVFIELGDVSGDLKSTIVAELGALGLPDKVETFEYLAKSEAMVLMLDGFDEVDETVRGQLAKEIRYVSERHSKLRIVLTSRPGTEIEGFLKWPAWQLAKLVPGEYRNVLRRVFPDEASDIEAWLEASHPEVRGLLITPLMVVLAAMRFRANSSGAPDDVPSFFGGLFRDIVKKHRVSLAVRNRSKLKEIELERVFSRFSLETAGRARASRYNEGIVQRALRVSLKDAELVGAVDDVLADICVSCLFLQQGAAYQFVHSAVQEYHAAYWVQLSEDAKAKGLYEEWANGWSFWYNEICLLESMDVLRCRRYWTLPIYAKMFATTDQGEMIRLVNDAIAVLFSETAGEPEIANVAGVYDRLSDGSPSGVGWAVRRALERWKLIESFPFNALRGIEFKSMPKEKSDGFLVVSAAELVEWGFGRGELLRFGGTIVELLRHEHDVIRRLMS